MDLDIKKAIQVLTEGGVIICPTEGIYGFSCIANNLDAVKRIIEIKKRDNNKGLILVSDSIEKVKNLIDIDKIPKKSLDLMHELWPGHHTFVVPCNSNVDPLLTGNRNTIAIRISNFHVLSSLCKDLPYPIVSTSANISGHDPLTTIDMLEKEFGDVVDYILKKNCQGLKKSSTIHDALTGQILRKG